MFVAGKEGCAFHPYFPCPFPVPVNLPDRGRRLVLERLTKFFDTEESVETVDDTPPRLTFKALEALRMSRSRERILSNLEEMYREAFERAKASEDPAQMAALDFSYRREQLYFEILLDVRDAMEKR
jgi:hypothetical protein